jgi:hypothetical protein
MTAHTRFRRIAAVATAALIAPLALVAATSASADAATLKRHKHEVTMYKVEKYIKLAGVGTTTVGDSPSQFLKCSSSSDSVLDGMWVVDHVDQYNPPNPDPADPDDNGFPTIPSGPTVTGGHYNDERDVWVRASYPDLVDNSQWNFRFENKAYGDAQLHVYITCIKGSTEQADSHSHAINVHNIGGSGTWLTSGPAGQFAPTGGVWNDDDNEADTGYNSSAAPGSPYGACGSNEYFVAPGFEFDTGYARLLGSAPVGFTGWQWRFAISHWDATSHLRLFGKCISNRTGFAGSPSHQHGIGMKHLGLKLKNNPYGDRRTFSYSCDEDDSSMHGYKAMVGSFWMNNYWNRHWFLGMEPQPKTRVFHFWNQEWSHNTADVFVGVFCVNSRTSNPLI